jgi:hypothetical protein
MPSIKSITLSKNVVKQPINPLRQAESRIIENQWPELKFLNLCSNDVNKQKADAEVAAYRRLLRAIGAY